jgi:DNA-binding NarL/FixJ family response regulator
MTDNLICLCGMRTRQPEAKPDTGACIPVLSQQESDVLCLLASGRENSEIARELTVSEDAVKEHIKSLFYKARARSKSQGAIMPQEQVRFFETTVVL